MADVYVLLLCSLYHVCIVSKTFMQILNKIFVILDCDAHGNRLKNNKIILLNLDEVRKCPIVKLIYKCVREAIRSFEN